MFLLHLRLAAEFLVTFIYDTVHTSGQTVLLIVYAALKLTIR